MTDLTVTLIEGGATLVAEVTGLPGHPPLWVMQCETGWRTLLPVHGLPVCLPERPPARRGDPPALGALLNAILGGTI